MRKYQPRNRAKLIEQANKNSLMTLLKADLSAQEKREMIAEKNPLHYLFGTVLNPSNYLIEENNDDLSI